MKPTPEQIANELPDLEIIKSVFGDFSVTKYSNSRGDRWVSDTDLPFRNVMTGMDWIRRKI